MLLVIPNVLDQNQLKVISRLLEDAEFEDGKLSAGKEAAEVKHNLELSQETRTGEVLHQQLNQMVMPTLMKHTDYQNSVYPLKVATPFYVRYDKGMNYGYHIDDPIMGNSAASLQERYRSDVSTTIFLNDDYQGGELVINTSAKREMLYELSQARESLLNENSDSLASKKVSNVYANLVRSWSDL